MVNDEFRFSPRPNRAADIQWMTWGPDAFQRAEAEDKPILLSISAVWCHWCHVMDETSYSDPDVIATINERYVPVRVDNDRRPDVNARYNMGGWPTTAFLAPDGTAITGGTYLAPNQMRRALDEIAQFYAGNKAQIEERSAQSRDRNAVYQPAPAGDLRPSMVVRLVEQITENYDAEYGGFGDAPKFPQPEMLEFLFDEWRHTGDQRLYAMIAKTIVGMSHGGMYDHVEGGFFRYSTTRDWSVPHFEKMAEDHAGLIRLLAKLVIFAPSNEYRATLISATRYVGTVLRDPKTGLFAGSQDADEEYFALPLEERRAREAPYVDRTSYTNWSCGLVSAGFFAARALDDDALLGRACASLDAVQELLIDEDGLAYHVLVPGSSPQVRGLLTDQTSYLRALLDAHEISGETRFLDRAKDLADRIVARFEAADGGFYDHIALEPRVGRLDVPDRPIGDNGIMADSLLRLSALTGEERFRDTAERTLTLFARTYAAAGSFAATYGRALRRYLTPEVTVKLLGTPEATAEFREVAGRLPAPSLSIRTVPPVSASASGLPSTPQPAAYVCAGTTCGAPATEPAGLRAAYDDLTAAR
jgi:uncharacterized protein YyaL (SSP411 family)